MGLDRVVSSLPPLFAAFLEFSDLSGGFRVLALISTRHFLRDLPRFLGAPFHDRYCRLHATCHPYRFAAKGGSPSSRGPIS